MNIIDALVLKDIKGVGDKTLAELLLFMKENRLHTLEELAKFGPSKLPLNRVPAALKEFLLEGQFETHRQQQSSNLIEWERQDIKTICLGSSDYPFQLLGLLTPPPILFVKGNIRLLENIKIIAVVGTRKNTKKGEQIAKKTVAYFSNKDFVIVSGLALGIDTIAHRAALENKGKTIAVLVDLISISPSSNRDLATEILKQDGLWLSENPPGTRMIPALFAKRDRLQAGLSLAVFAIETTIDGGTMHAVKASQSMKRNVYVPDAKAAKYPDLNEPAISGTQHLVEKGVAETYTRASYEDIIKYLDTLSLSLAQNIQQRLSA